MDPSFFGLSGHPFTKPAAPDSHCLADEHLALTTELHAGLKAPHGITLLIGDEGAGKSTFIRSFVGQLPDSFVVAYLPTAGPGLRHLLTEAVEQLGGTVVPGGGEQALIDVLRSLARARADHDRSTLVVIDDAHELPAKTIERLGKLFGSDPAEPSRLHVTLVGRPELLDRMNAANDRSILKHLVQVCRMDGIGPEDAFRYIADRVQKVGGIVDRLFSEDALRLIVQRANGNPARIDQICSAALERAATRGAQAVDTDAVDTACTSEAPMGGTQGGVVQSDSPEAPTYFFNEDDAETAPTSAPATPRDTRPVSPSPISAAVPVVAGATSRRRLAFWAAGAITVVAAFAGMMTLPERTAIDTDKTADGEAPIVTAKAERRADKQGAGTASESKGDGVEEPSAIAVPKLVVRRNGDGGALGTRAAGRKSGDPVRGAPAEVASAPAGASGLTSAPSSEVASERPRFPAPPLGPAAAPSVAAATPQAPQAVPPPNQGTSVAAATPQGVATQTAPTPEQTAPVPAATAATPSPTVPPVTVSSPGTTPSLPPAAAPAAPAATPAPAGAITASKPGDAGLVAPTRATVRPSGPVVPAVAAPKPAPKVIAKAAPPPVAASVAPTAGAYTIQVGAFSSRANAEALVGKIRGNAPDGRIIASTTDGKPVFRVVIGSFGSPAEAALRSRELAKAGLSTFVRRAN